MRRLFLLEVGRPPDPRPFVPHLTLARIRDARKDPRDEFGKDIKDIAWPCFTVGGLVLWESVLHPDGARYRIQKLFPAFERAN